MPVNFLPKQGYFVQRAPYGAGTPAHYSGGTCPLAGAVSPNTNRPLLQLLSIDLTDDRLGFSGMGGIKRLPLLYSWSCGIYQQSFFYMVEKASIRVIQYGSGNGESDFPFPNYPAAFQQVEVALQAIREDEQQVIAAINRSQNRFDVGRDHPTLSVPRTQVGGEPLLLQWPGILNRCKQCDGEMAVVASVANRLPSGEIQTENDFVQVVFSICVQCLVVNAENYCD